MIGDEIAVTVPGVNGKQARIGITARKWWVYMSVITIIDVVMFTLFDGLVGNTRRLQAGRYSCQWCSR
jgi:hypothetical protein